MGGGYLDPLKERESLDPHGKTEKCEHAFGWKIETGVIVTFAKITLGPLSRPGLSRKNRKTARRSKILSK